MEKPFLHVLDSMWPDFFLKGNHLSLQDAKRSNEQGRVIGSKASLRAIWVPVFCSTLGICWICCTSFCPEISFLVLPTSFALTRVTVVFKRLQCRSKTGLGWISNQILPQCTEYTQNHPKYTQHSMVFPVHGQQVAAGSKRLSPCNRAAVSSQRLTIFAQDASQRAASGSKQMDLHRILIRWGTHHATFFKALDFTHMMRWTCSQRQSQSLFHFCQCNEATST